jgi:hypothetical protein
MAWRNRGAAQVSTTYRLGSLRQSGQPAGAAELSQSAQLCWTNRFPHPQNDAISVFTSAGTLPCLTHSIPLEDSTMLRALLLLAVVGLCVCVVPAPEPAPAEPPSHESTPAAAPCSCSSGQAELPALEETTEVAWNDETTVDEETTSKVCLFYVWANHGSWCSWYGFTCDTGPPRNVDTTNCGISGSCSSGQYPGCLTLQRAPATGRKKRTFNANTVTFELSKSDNLHPGRQGYKGDKYTKKPKLDKPKDKDLDVVENSKQHVTLTYTTSDEDEPEHSIDAQIFSYDVSHKKHPGTGTMWVGFEIEKPASGTGVPIPDDKVTETGPRCVTVEFNGTLVDIILHEGSPETVLAKEDPDTPAEE